MKQSKDFFWPSYVDLMTALFLTMLVLFVLSYKLFKDKEQEKIELIQKLQAAKAVLEVQLQEKKKLDEIKAALSLLNDGKNFVYNEAYKRYELSFEVSFPEGKAELKEADKRRIIQAGRFLLGQLNAQNGHDGIQYLIAVEGRAARYVTLHPDGSYSYADKRNSDGASTRQLSYERAMAVIRLWQGGGVNFPSPRYEVVAAGSGFGGTGRYQGSEEWRNRRFVIQIQPKIGSIQ